MYESMPNRNVVYSPLPTRHYVRMGAFARTYPAACVMQSRNQAWWNLIWLAYPEVDEVFKAVDEASFAAYQDINRPKMKTDYPLIRSLLWDIELIRGIAMSEAAKIFNPREFVEYLGRLPYLKTKYFHKKGGKTFALMQQRAELAETGRLYLMNPPAGTQAIVAGKSEYEKVIQPSIDARISWLEDATALFEEHIRKAGFEVPKVKIEMDRLLLSRYGICYRSDNGEPNRIGISPTFIDMPEVLGTLLHELVHAIDNNVHDHGKVFIEIANRLGFTGHKLPIMPGESLKGLFQDIRNTLGPYPHFIVEFR